MRFTPHQKLAAADTSTTGRPAASEDSGGGGGGGSDDAVSGSGGSVGGVSVGGVSGGFGVWLPRRSLLLFKDDVYTDFLHGIQDVAADVVDESVVNWRRAAEVRPGRVDGVPSSLPPSLPAPTPLSPQSHKHVGSFHHFFRYTHALSNGFKWFQSSMLFRYYYLRTKVNR